MTTWTVIGRAPVESLSDLDDGTYVFMGGDGETMILDTLAASTPGYVVAIKPYDENGPRPMLFRGQLLGVWKDREDDKVYIDKVEVWHEEEDALNAAANRGELAIWDLNNGKEIRV